MSGERYIEQAVEALYDHVSGGAFADRLTEAEGSAGLADNALGRPEAYLQHRFPFDNRPMLAGVWDEDAEAINFRVGHWRTNCTFAVTFRGDSNLDNGEIKGRRILTAMIDTIKNDPTLGGLVVDAHVTDASRDTMGDESATRHVYAIGVSVETRSTGATS